MIDIIKCQNGREMIPATIMSLWDDHYVPEDRLFDDSYIKEKGAKDMMLKILKDRDMKKLNEMCSTKNGLALWDCVATSASLYALSQGNTEYEEMCDRLGVEILLCYPKDEWPQIPGSVERPVYD